MITDQVCGNLSYQDMRTLTVRAFHFLVLAAVIRLLKPFCMAGRSPAVGGASSTRAYFMNSFSLGSAQVWQAAQQINKLPQLLTSHSSYSLSSVIRPACLMVVIHYQSICLRRISMCIWNVTLSKLCIWMAKRSAFMTMVGHRFVTGQFVSINGWLWYIIWKLWLQLTVQTYQHMIQASTVTLARCLFLSCRVSGNLTFHTKMGQP